MKKRLLITGVWIVLMYALVVVYSTNTYFDYSYESDIMVADTQPKQLWHLANFDGAHYQNIAQFGYVKVFLRAFFPFFPFLVKQVSFLTGNYLVTALAMSLFSFLFSILLLDKIYKKNISLITFLLLIFPLSFFFLTGYTESLFLLLSLLSWVFASKNKYLFSGVFGLLASITRFYGILLFPALALKFYLKLSPNKRHRLKSYLSAMPLLLIPLGLLGYMSYLYLNFQDPFLFFHAQRFWQRSTLIFPLQTLYRYIKILLTVSPTIYQYWIAVLELLSFFFGLFAAFLLWRWKLLPQSLYVFLGVIVPVFTGTLQSMPRFLLVLFPIYFVLAKLIANNSKITQIIIILALILLQIILFTNFLQGYFVA